jgi:mannose-6-phosphate isomerase-like protein (cupin superfamily)
MPRMYKSINIQDKFQKITEYWEPKVIAQLNNYQLKLAKINGQFVWHNHPETDEIFIVIKGNMDIEFRDGKVSLKEGELFVVPKGKEHKPIAVEECSILVIEPIGTVNTGNAGGNMTAPSNVWI